MKDQAAWDALAWLEHRVRSLEDAAGQIRPRPEWSAADLQAYLIADGINGDWDMDEYVAEINYRLREMNDYD